MSGLLNRIRKAKIIAAENEVIKSLQEKGLVMKTIMKVEVEPVFVEFIPNYENMEQGKVYISEEYQTSVHKCLCGCGEKTVMPLGKNGWTLTKHESGKVSFAPSVGNYQFACKSHYIITKNVANFV